MFVFSLVINAQEFHAFKDEKGKWGFKDSAGSVVVIPQYDNVLQYKTADSSALFVVNNGGELVIKRDAEPVNDIVTDSIFYDYYEIPLILGGKSAILHSQNYEDVVPQFDSITLQFYYYHMYDYDKEQLIKSSMNINDTSGYFQYQDVFANLSDYAGFSNNGKWGCISSNNKIVFEPKYEQFEYLAFSDQNIEKKRIDGNKITFALDEAIEDKVNAWTIIYKDENEMPLMNVYFANADIDTIQYNAEIWVVDIWGEEEMIEETFPVYTFKSGDIYLVDTVGSLISKFPFEDIYVRVMDFTDQREYYLNAKMNLNEEDYAKGNFGMLDGAFASTQKAYAIAKGKWWSVDLYTYEIKKLPYKSDVKLFSDRGQLLVEKLEE